MVGIRKIFCASALAAFCTVVAVMQPVAGSAETAPLRELAAAKKLRIGAAVSPIPLQDEEAYGETLAREFNLVTTENHFKFRHVHPKEELFNFTGAKTIIEFARAHDMDVRGHCLVWHGGDPKWLTEKRWRKDELKELLRKHIHTLVGEWRGRVDIWDVVNEAVGEDGGMRKTFWLKNLGPDYVDWAFEWAYESDPEAKLFYNDYGGEGLNEKSDAIYEFVQALQERGVPFHGVGLQMHVSLDDYPPPKEVAANIHRLAALGLEVHITELDVSIEGEVTPEKLEKQAEIYRQYMEVCVSEPGCTAFILWGFTDAHSWIPKAKPGKGAGLIFDKDYKPKPAYNALREVLEG